MSKLRGSHRSLWAGFLATAALAVALGARPGQARAEAVGLGVMAGGVFPVADNKTLDAVLKASFGYGFFVDIPLIASFHLTPSALVYRVNDTLTAADMGLSFKFIVTTPFIRPYVGLNAGTTVFGAGTDFSVGGIGGAYFNLVANLDAFVQGGYSVIVRDAQSATNPGGGNVKVGSAAAGVLIRFQ